MVSRPETSLPSTLARGESSLLCDLLHAESNENQDNLIYDNFMNVSNKKRVISKLLLSIEMGLSQGQQLSRHLQSRVNSSCLVPEKVR